MRQEFLIGALIVIAAEIVMALYYPAGLWSLIFFGPLLLLGFQDYFQKRQAIKRNFPILGRFRYFFEAIRPEINQYFVESNSDGVPFSREKRSVVYQRAKGALDTLPFGTQKDVYEPGYEWFAHSIAPTHVDHKSLFITVGGPDCKQPYALSLLNISAMSYGSLSKNAVLALNGGAKDGGFAHNTGEGGISPYHLEPGGDLIWQLGTGYFGCRTEDGDFDEKLFSEKAQGPTVKMVEIKLSQGAKPGHGGILPAAKVTEEIAAIRHVPMGKTVHSPPGHRAFSTPLELLDFIVKLRELSGGKPIGIKLCLGKHREFIALCKAMHQRQIFPDYIAVDGAEGGTGAAPLEFSNSIGTPLVEALIFVHNALTGFGIRKHIKVLAAGKVTTAGDMARLLALGADAIYSARAMMLALGCIQALRCNHNNCPAGVATQNPHLIAGLDVTDKRTRVANFHKETLESLAEVLSAMGLNNHEEITPYHVVRRLGVHEIASYAEIYDFIGEGALLQPPYPKGFDRSMERSRAESFHF